jgi:hypothetical protein
VTIGGPMQFETLKANSVLHHGRAGRVLNVRRPPLALPRNTRLEPGGIEFVDWERNADEIAFPAPGLVYKRRQDCPFVHITRLFVIPGIHKGSCTTTVF